METKLKYNFITREYERVCVKYDEEKKYYLEYLNSLETMSETQTDDLKIETGGVRVWLSRVGIDNGMPCDNQVTIEVYRADIRRWITVDKYEAV